MAARKLIPTEHAEQCAVIEWAAMNQSRIPQLRLLHAIPNGGARHPAVALKLKAEGVKRGVPDLSLPVPMGDRHGLYIEMKRRGGRIEQEQKEWINDLMRLGYRVDVCWDADEAIKTIGEYLDVDSFCGEKLRDETQ